MDTLAIMLGAIGAALRRRQPARSDGGVVLVCSPAASVDDLHALLVAAVLHSQRQLRLAAVVATGARGAPRAEASAALARCVLAQLGVTDVPVAVGTDAFVRAVDAHLADGACARAAALAAALSAEGVGARGADAGFASGQTLLVALLRGAADHSLTLVCLSALTDVCALLRAAPDLCRAKVRELVLSGGARRHGGGWVADESAPANAEDPAAAAFVYATCLAPDAPSPSSAAAAAAGARGPALAVVSRASVPPIPLQLARSFAARSREPLLRALAAGQAASFQRLSADATPADDADAMPADAQLTRYLSPAGASCLLLLLPSCAHALPAAESAMVDRRHRLFLAPRHRLPADVLQRVIRDCYHHAILLAYDARAAAPKRHAGASTIGAAVCALYGNAGAPAPPSAASAASAAADGDQSAARACVPQPLSLIHI